MTKQQQEKALEAVKLAFAAADAELETLAPQMRRVKEHAAKLATEVLELRARVASLGGLTPASVEVEQGPDETLQGAIARAGAQVGSSPFFGLARVVLAPRTPTAIVLGPEDHAWWRLGTLELAAREGQHSAVLGIRLESPHVTGGQCGLVLRNIDVRGEVLVQAPGGIAFRLVGTSRVFPPPNPVAIDPL